MPPSEALIIRRAPRASSLRSKSRGPSSRHFLNLQFYPPALPYPFFSPSIRSIRCVSVSSCCVASLRVRVASTSTPYHVAPHPSRPATLPSSPISPSSAALPASSVSRMPRPQSVSSASPVQDSKRQQTDVCKGDLRWQPPASPTAAAATVSATAQPNQCPQAGFGLQITNPYANITKRDLGTSEDCLYLNVHVPSSATPSSNLPVIIWVHGGGSVSLLS